MNTPYDTKELQMTATSVAVSQKLHKLEKNEVFQTAFQKFLDSLLRENEQYCDVLLSTCYGITIQDLLRSSDKACIEAEFNNNRVTRVVVWFKEHTDFTDREAWAVVSYGRRNFKVPKIYLQPIQMHMV